MSQANLPSPKMSQATITLGGGEVKNLTATPASSFLYIKDEDWDFEDDAELRVSVYTCDEYVSVWSSSWGGGRGSDARNIWWDLNGLANIPEYIRIVAGDTILNPRNESTEAVFERLYAEDKDAIKIVWVSK